MRRILSQRSKNKGGSYIEIIISFLLVISFSVIILNSIQNTNSASLSLEEKYKLNLLIKSILDKSEMNFRNPGIEFFHENQSIDEFLNALEIEFPSNFYCKITLEEINSAQENKIVIAHQDISENVNSLMTNYDKLFLNEEADISEDIFIEQKNDSIDLKKGAEFVNISDIIEIKLSGANKDISIKYITDGEKKFKIINNSTKNTYFKVISQKSGIPEISYDGKGILYTSLYKEAKKKNYFLHVSIYNKKKELLYGIGTIL